MQLDKQPQPLPDEQAFHVIGCLLTLADAILAAGFHKVEMETTLQEARALDALARKSFWTMTEFAGELGVTLPTASHTADRLVKKHVVKRSRSLQDRRIVLISLSRKGLERHNAILQNRVRVCSELLRQLTPAQRQAAVAAIQDLAAVASSRLTKENEESYESVR